MNLEILTPEKKLYSGDAESVKFPGVSGAFEILNNHAPLISALEKGSIVVRNGKEENSFEINGGFVEVLNNQLSALVEE
jgi:F-type H+-transporting ATPase subunit epsilon